MKQCLIILKKLTNGPINRTTKKRMTYMYPSCTFFKISTVSQSVHHNTRTGRFTDYVACSIRSGWVTRYAN